MMTETAADYPEWAMQLCSWKYLWMVELGLLLLIVILIIIACRLYFQLKEAEGFLKKKDELP